MILFFIVVGLAVAGVILFVIGTRRFSEGIQFFGVMLTIVFGLAVAIMTLAIICENSLADLKLSRWQARREAIVYQVEHNMYYGEALGEFNADVIRKKILHDSPWTNWFEGDYILEVDTIDLN